MSRYYFSITDGQRMLGDREGTELGGLAEVQREALEFGRTIFRHRFAYGIEDLSPWSIRVTNDIGRVLAVLPLARFRPARRDVLPAD